MYNNSGINLKFIISNDSIIVNERSIGVRVRRSDGVLLPNFEYLPRYKRSGEPLVEIIEEDRWTTTITIPKWLYDKRFGYGCRISFDG